MPIRPPFADRIEHVESGGQDYPPDSSAGAIGPMQIMPSTAADYGYTADQIRVPAVNRMLGHQILSENMDRYNGNETLAAIAYNGGRGRADAVARGDMSISELPRETQGYIRKVSTAGEDAPAGINPNLDPDIAADNQHKADVMVARDLINSIDTAATPAERSSMMSANGLNEDNYLLLKHAAGVYPSPEEAAAQQQRIEGTSQGLQAPPAYLDPVEIAAGSMGFGKALVESGVAIPRALAGTAAANEFLGVVQQRAREFFPNHPGIAQVVGATVGMALLTGGVGALSQFQQPGAAAPEGEPGITPQAPEAVEGTPSAGTQPAEAQPAPPPPLPEIATAAGGAPPEGAPTELPPEAEVPPTGAQAEAPQGAAAAPSAEAQPEPTPPAAAPPVVRPPGIEHTDIAIETAAAARPMTASEIASIPLVGEDEHIMPANNLDVVDELRVRNYTDATLERIITNARVAAETGDEQAADVAAAATKETVNVVKPAYDAANHQAGLQLRHAGDPNTREVLNQVVSANAANADNVALMRALAKLKTPAERAELARVAAITPKWSWRGMLYQYYVNSLLSLNSVGKKLASDTANTIFQIPVRALAQYGSRAAELATGSPYGSIGVPPGEIQSTIKGLVGGFGEMAQAGLESSLAKERPKFSLNVGFYDQPTPPASLMAGSGFENTWWGRAINGWGHLTSLPGKGLSNVNDFSMAANFRMEAAIAANRQAFQDAAGEGLTGAKLSARQTQLTNRYLAKLPKEMINDAMTGTKATTFQADLGESAAKFNTFRQSSYLARTMLPWFKTPINIAGEGMRLTPAAVINPTWWKTMAAGGAPAAIQLTKTAMGTALCGWSMYKTLDGSMTGGNPYRDNPEMSKLWLADHQEYSFNLGQGPDGKTRWQSYQGWEPFSWLMGSCADAAPTFSYLKDGEADRAVAQLSFAAVNEIKRETMWGSVHNVMQVLDDAGKGKVTKVMNFLGREAGGLIPSTIANYAGETDPVRRQTLSFLDELRNRIPYLRRNGIPTLDPIYGKPMLTPTGFLNNEWPAFKVAHLLEDPLAAKMEDLHNSADFAPPEIPKSLGGAGEPTDTGMTPTDQVYGVNLSPELQNRWLELRATIKNPEGLTLAEKLRQTAESPLFKAAEEQNKPKLQAAMWHADFMGYQKVAEGALLKEHQELMQQLKDAYTVKARAFQVGAAPARGLGAP